MTVHNHCL